VSPKNVWLEDPDEERRRFASSVALVSFARSSSDLHPEHPKRLADEAIWFWTERGSRTRKYNLRFRTPAALSLQQSRVARQVTGQLRHDHVHERAKAVVKLLDPNSDPSTVLRSLHACVVTQDEHVRLTRERSMSGWARYKAAGIVPIDMATGEPMDLSAAIMADKALWSPDAP
jgi:hypothetical protein